MALLLADIAVIALIFFDGFMGLVGEDFETMMMGGIICPKCGCLNNTEYCGEYGNKHNFCKKRRGFIYFKIQIFLE